MLAYSKSQFYSLLPTVSFCICFLPSPFQFQVSLCLLCLRAQYWSAKSYSISSEQQTGVSNSLFISHGHCLQKLGRGHVVTGFSDNERFQPIGLAWDWRTFPEPRNWLEKVSDKTIDLWKMDSPSTGHPSSPPRGSSANQYLESRVLMLSLSVSWVTRAEEDKSVWRNKRCLSKPPIVKPYSFSFSSSSIHKVS